MKHTLHVGDDTVRLIDNQAKTEVAAEHTNILSKTFLGVNRAPTGLMPPAIRWISGDGQTYLIERPPAFMTLSYTPAKASRACDLPAVSYSLPLPWSLYVVSFDDITTDSFNRLSIFLRAEPLRSVEDQLCYLPLPNLDAFESICCLGKGFTGEFKQLMAQARAQGRWDAAFAAVSVINLFWQLNFNDDMGHISIVTVPKSCYQRKALWEDVNHERLRSTPWLEQWAKMSLSDALAMDWVPYIPLAKILARCEQRRPPLYGGRILYVRQNASLSSYLYTLIKTGKV